MQQRPKIPARLRRLVLKETGHRCAVPGCGHEALEAAHIVPHSECHKHEFDNLIALCPNHHTEYDNGRIPRQTVLEWKRELRAKTSPDPGLTQALELIKEQNEQIRAQNEQIKSQNEQLLQKIEHLEMMLPQQSGAAASDTLEEIKHYRKADQFFRAGLKAYDRAKFLEALKAWEESRKLEITANVLHNLGMVYSDLERHETALQVYAEAERLRREQGLQRDPDLVLNRGVIYRRLGRYEEALQSYAEAENLRLEHGLPPNPTLAMNRGVVYYDQRHYENALQAYEEAERLRQDQGLPRDPTLAMNRGVVYRDLGRFEDALQAYAEAEQLRREQKLPKDPRLSANRGAALTNLDQLKEAFRHFDNAESIFKEQGVPPEPMFFVYRGEAYLKSGDRARACQDAQKATAQAAKLKRPEPKGLAELLAAACG